MAQKKNGASGTTTRSSAEMQNWYQGHKNEMQFASATEALKKLRDVNKDLTKNIHAFDKEDVIMYLQRVGSYEKKLREVSNYLYFRSQIYYRLVNFYASMFELDARSVVPRNDTEGEAMVKSYMTTVNTLDRMNLARHFKPVLTTIFREDIFYGVYWLDEQGMTVIPIDPNYARINGIYPSGNFSYCMNMVWFTSRADILEYWGEPFTTMYNTYKATNEKWQEVPAEHCICFKFNTEDWDLIVPPLVGIFLSLISLEDLSDLTAVQDELQIYKLLLMKMKPMSSSKVADDFEISPDLSVKYFDKMINEALPDYVSAALIPGTDDLQVVSFSDDATTDTTKIETATEAVLNTAGGAEVLNGSTINSTAAFNAAQIANTNFALSSILPQIEGWVEMVLNIYVDKPCKVKYFKVSSYTKTNLKEDFLKAAQNGLPTKLAYMSLNNFSEQDTMSLNKLEEALDIPNIFRPLNTSYTQSGEAGRPQVDDDELSDSGDRTRNQ